jgi:surfeit locus 1 family protein
VRIKFNADSHRDDQLYSAYFVSPLEPTRFSTLMRPLVAYLRAFQPRLIPSLAALGAFVLTMYLGHWQQGRADEKRGLQTQFDQRSIAEPLTLRGETLDPQMAKFRRASASGTWVESAQIYIDNKFDQNTVGYHVITPLKLAGSERHVLVNRGWVARGAGYPVPPNALVPMGQIDVNGTITLPTDKFLELTASTASGSVWQNLTIERFRAASKLDVLPFVLLANDVGPELRVVVQQPDAGVAKHVEYMLTWYSLAATVVVLWLVLNFKTRRAATDPLSKIGHAS